MTDHVRITDVSPRDGLQNERGVVATADKVTLIEALSRADVNEIEATSFVSPKWVPQLGDAGEVLEALRQQTPLTLALSRRERGKSGDAHPAPVLTVLVPNAKGFERAKQFHSPEFPLKIAVFTAASETFNQKNTNASIAESIDRFREFIPEAMDLGMAVRLYVSTVVACPYEGAIAPAQVRRVCDQLIDLVGREPFAHGDAELDLGDTIGAATPGDIHALLAPFEEDELRSIVIHLHDTFGRAADCVKASLQAGIRSFDGSVAGLGGCPFAGTKESPAPGNISTELLVQTVQAEGFSTDVDQHALQQAAAIARDIVGKARAAEV